MQFHHASKNAIESSEVTYSTPRKTLTYDRHFARTNFAVVKWRNFIGGIHSHTEIGRNRQFNYEAEEQFLDVFYHLFLWVSIKNFHNSSDYAP